MYLGSLITEDGKSETEDQEKKNYITDHIHQHENTTIVPRHTPDYYIERNKMLCPVDTTQWSTDINIITKSLLSRLDAFVRDVDISQSIGNTMYGTDYQRGSVEKDESMQIFFLDNSR